MFLTLPAAAQIPPACNNAREGQLICMAGRLCACRYETGGSLTGRPSAHRWDCGPLRPDCRPEPMPQATIPFPIFPQVFPQRPGPVAPFPPPK